MTLEYRVGDVFDRLAEIPDGTIDLIVTSPPFLALRSYLPIDHPDKHKEIGSEPTPAEFIDTLLALTAEFGRVLAPHGSICVELGDTYAGSGGAGGDYNPGGLREGQETFKGSAARTNPGRSERHIGQGHTRSISARAKQDELPKRGNGWPLAKSLTGIPTLYPWSLAYGRNLLTGQDSPAGQWRIRNVIVWARPNPPVGALGDKFRHATSYITVACKGPRRYFDLDAVRGPGSPNTHARLAQGVESRPTTGKKADHPDNNFGTMSEIETVGAPPLDWHADDHPEDGDWLWKLSTQPYSGSHYATFPMALPKRMIEAMCPLRVCTTCGKPSERIVGSSSHMAQQPEFAAHLRERRQAAGLTMKAINAWFPGNSNWCGHWEDTTSQPLLPTTDQWSTLTSRLDLDQRFADIMTERSVVEYLDDGRTIDRSEHRQAFDRGGKTDAGAKTKASRVAPKEWTDCGHDAWRTGVVLDPFAGSGTTLEAAQAVGRHAIGIDLDERNAHLAQSRVGMFLEVTA